MGEGSSFDFDHWARLARNDPSAFERQRRTAIARALRRVPRHRRPRLRALQWRIDQVRRSSSTPLAACIRLSEMMWESVHGGRGLAAVLRRPRPSGPTAAVIPFPRSGRGD